MFVKSVRGILYYNHAWNLGPWLVIIQASNYANRGTLTGRWSGELPSCANTEKESPRLGDIPILLVIRFGSRKRSLLQSFHIMSSTP